MGSAVQMLNSGNTYRVAEANYNFNVKTQQANNANAAAQAALGNFQITEGNRRKMESAGVAYNDAMENINKALSKASANDLNIQLQAANTQGQLRAQAAAAGVGGSSVEALNSLLELQKNTALQANGDDKKSIAINGGKSAGQIIDNTVASFDNSQKFGSFDFTTYQKPVKQKNMLGALATATVATVYGGPMAGQAVLDTTQSFNQAANGNQQAAAAFGNSAAQNTVGAYKDWSSYQPNEGEHVSWFKNTFKDWFSN